MASPLCRGYVRNVAPEDVASKGGIVNFSASASDIEHEFSLLISSGHAPHLRPLIQTSSHHSTRDYGRVTIHDTASFYRARWENWWRNRIASKQQVR